MSDIPDTDEDAAIADVREVIKDVVTFLGPATFGATGVSAVATAGEDGFRLIGLPSGISENRWIADNAGVVTSTCTGMLSSLDVLPVVPVIVESPAGRRHGPLRLGQYNLPRPPSTGRDGLN